MLRGSREWTSAPRSAALGVVLLVACSNDAGALIRDRPEDAGRQVRDEELWLPVQPDESNVPACEACAKEKCGTARSNCLEDDACIALLSCKGECSDPGCLQDCQAEHGLSSWYDDLWACVLNEACTSECRSGENWACAGNYDWRPGSENPFPVTFRFENPRVSPASGGDSRIEIFLAGVEARTCSGPDVPCIGSDRLDSGLIDATNRVELEVRRSGLSTSFNGMLELEGDLGAFGVKDRWLGPPLTRRMETWVFFTTRDYLQIEKAQLGPGGTFDFEQGAPLTLRIQDCTGVGGRARFELPDLPGVEPVVPGELAYLGIVPDIPAADRADWLAVRAITESGELVAERDVFVSAGWVTHVSLYPRAR